ncbi:MAG: zinc ABC transporter substrate-binding protein [Oscillospiraceae bacterium]|nr:zinc ABC transporter substrate-binding protein [Oscillospiraceae bacterium]
MRYCKLLIVLIVLSALLLGCGRNNSTGATGSTTRPDVKGKPISVVATVFPAYDWARQIIGEDNERVALTLLLDKGADFHSYQPTVEDIYKISTCDLFIYVGGESDKWVPDALAQATNKDMTVLCLLDALGSAVREEEAPEGAEAHEEEEAEGPSYDEHIWLSLRNARTLCASIREAMIGLDDDGGKTYWPNFKAYDEKLNELEHAYAETIAAAPRRILLFADRFPFLYLAKDYDLTCFAAFSGCSAESEASFETVNFLVNMLDELELSHILVLEGGDTRLAETIIANSRAKSAQVLSINSLQSVTARMVDEGVTYLGVMEQNLEVLKQALN